MCVQIFANKLGNSSLNIFFGHYKSLQYTSRKNAKGSQGVTYSHKIDENPVELPVLT